jgi:hypothetical protein
MGDTKEGNPRAKETNEREEEWKNGWMDGWIDGGGRRKEEDGRTGREDKNRGCKISRRGFFLGDFFRERAGRRETEGDWSRTKHRQTI